MDKREIRSAVTTFSTPGIQTITTPDSAHFPVGTKLEVDLNTGKLAAEEPRCQRFKVGQKVLHHAQVREVLEVTQSIKGGTFLYTLIDSAGCPSGVVDETFLQPYTKLQPPAKKTEAQARKDKPIARGCLDYFPAALLAVAELSRIGNEQHQPGAPMHHARGKSADHADCLLRHLIDRGTLDTDGVSHTVKVAWRALALLQEELEAAGAPLARGARLPK